MLTIFTPTYNRAYILSNLFESLQNQSAIDFKWLIVDDGSTDNTNEVIESFKQSANFPIEYIYQNNQGKHVAINTAINHCNTLYFCTVDSDDYFKANVLDVIYKKLLTIQTDYNIIGIASPIEMVDKNKKIIPSSWKINSDILATPIEINYKYNITGEFTLFYKTQIIKKYSYPVFADEKFMVESVLTNRLNNNYKILHIPYYFVIGEYREDGLTNQRKKLLINNPKGASLAFCEKMNNNKIPFSYRKLFAKNYWDYESLIGTSVNDKLIKIKSFRLRLFLILYFTKRYFLKNK